MRSCALVIACALLAACGKKGPPLAPISHFPAAIANPAIDRVGDNVYVSVTVPVKNIDGSMPADVARIEVYGVTALRPPTATQMLAVGRRVANVPVAPPPPKGEPQVETDKPVQGSMVSVADTLGADDLAPKDLPVPALRTGARATPVAPAPAPPPDAEPDEAPLPQRFYMAIAFNTRGRPGPPGAVNGVPLAPLPDPPTGLDVTYTADTITVTWEPPASAPAAGPNVPPALVTQYNVYRTLAPDPLELPAAPAQPWSMTRPAPANAAPLLSPPFTAPTEFDREVCFAVSTVRGTAPAAVEGSPMPSPPLCVTPVDTFPPGAPKSLSAVAAEGTISLIWEPNSEPDLGGYLVLRGEAGSDTLQPLTAMPIAEAQFTDRTVRSGVRYVYAVVAVDNRLPVPNVSAESNRVEETAR